jgi:hypothetical protein
VHTELIGIPRRRLLRELLEDGLQIRVGVSDRHARADPEIDAVIDVGLEPDLQRNVDIRSTPAEPRRHHADDLIVLANELDRAANDAGSPE